MQRHKGISVTPDYLLTPAASVSVLLAVAGGTPYPAQSLLHHADSGYQDILSAVAAYMSTVP